MAERKKQILAIYLSLTVITLIAFWQVSRCDFINFDDPVYVTENVHVQNGITAGALSWAFTTGHAANWHPLTWISHMLDVRLFGLNPHGHHLISLLLHIANTLLLFFVLHRMTKATWKSAFVAALFAVHPLHVESVAWVAERKDVLSTFFWMLTMCAYVYYAEQPRVKSYLAVFAFFALGLMAKPMLVTLPFVLLLLDYWPLQRLRAAGSREQEASSENQNPSLERKPLSANKTKGKSGKKRTGPGVAEPSVARTTSSSSPIGLSSAGPEAISPPSSVLRFLLLEKTPLFALAVVSSTAAFIAQKKGGSVASLEAIPAGTRIANALVSYIVYIRKMVWPADLAMYYPYPGPLSIWHALGASLLLAALTFAVIRRAKSFPYLAVGWLWFAGTLVPVIGIVQIGNQAMADRYTYSP